MFYLKYSLHEGEAFFKGLKGKTRKRALTRSILAMYRALARLIPV